MSLGNMYENKLNNIQKSKQQRTQWVWLTADNRKAAKRIQTKKQPQEPAKMYHPHPLKEKRDENWTGLNFQEKQHYLHKWNKISPFRFPDEEFEKKVKTPKVSQEEIKEKFWNTVQEKKQEKIAEEEDVQ